ncbi:hypothetical protein CEXT_755471 [Caerostris extrusa]|uniref:Uncharacterized protein n=1 Tax=Caerostris extrusa TaxID=172846 RepID=A0AAV4P0H9_CAEEX|nr:hypothetical protein CEXT_755471 [Caerostris extrusa]
MGMQYLVLINFGIINLILSTPQALLGDIVNLGCKQTLLIIDVEVFCKAWIRLQFTGLRNKGESHAADGDYDLRVDNLEQFLLRVFTSYMSTKPNTAQKDLS